MTDLLFALKKADQADRVKTFSAEFRELSDKLKETKAKIDEAVPPDEKVKEKVLKKYAPVLSIMLGNLDAELKRVNGMGLGKETGDKIVEVIRSYKTMEQLEPDPAGGKK